MSIDRDNGTVSTSNPVISLKDRIKAAHDITREVVQVAEWDVTLYVQSMTGRQRDRFEERMTVQKGKSREANLANFRARLVAACAVNEDGTLLFDETDVAWLGDKNAAALAKVADVAMRLSGFTKEDAEELAGNSPSGQSDDSGSA